MLKVLLVNYKVIVPKTPFPDAISRGKNAFASKELKFQLKTRFNNFNNIIGTSLEINYVAACRDLPCRCYRRSLDLVTEPDKF